MAITTSSIALPARVSEKIIANALEESAVLRLVDNKIRIKHAGEAIPVIAGDPTAYVVGEGQVKTNSDSSLATVTMKPKTFAVIEAFSNQFRDDNEALYQELVARLPRVIAQKFDDEVFHGTTSANFHTLAGVSAVSLAGGSAAWSQLVAARAAVEGANGELTAWAMANQGITALLGEVDGASRPLFVGGDTAIGGIGAIAGAPVVKAKAAYKDGASSNPDIIGYAGDWSNAVVGIARDVNIAISDEATLTVTGGTLNLFESNMFAVRCEFTLGFITGFASSNVPTQFVAITE
jgi:HK97 family phage major capsid protein